MERCNFEDYLKLCEGAGIKPLKRIQFDKLNTTEPTITYGNLMTPNYGETITGTGITPLAIKLARNVPGVESFHIFFDLEQNLWHITFDLQGDFYDIHFNILYVIEKNGDTSIESRQKFADASKLLQFFVSRNYQSWDVEDFDVYFDIVPLQQTG